MNVNPPKEFVDGDMASGEYGAASGVARDALRRLPHEIAIGLDQVAVGRLSNRSVTDIESKIDE